MILGGIVIGLLEGWWMVIGLVGRLVGGMAIGLRSIPRNGDETTLFIINTQNGSSCCVVNLVVVEVVNLPNHDKRNWVIGQSHQVMSPQSLLNHSS